MSYELTSSESAVIIILVPLLMITFAGAVCIHSCTRSRRGRQRALHKNCIAHGCDDGAYTEVAAVELNGDIANGRLVSHDRALPEIPASASGVASTDDDEEEGEGHYDVISGSRRAATLPSNSRTTKSRFCHPYEIVAGDLDSTYAGIRDELESVISHRNSRRQANRSVAAATAVAVAIPDPLYAGIADNGNSRVQTSRPAVSLLSGIRPASTHSTAVNNQLHVNNHAVEPDNAVPGSARGDNDAESPLLPPRNGHIDVIDGGVTSVVVCSAWTAAMSTLSASITNNVPSVATSAAAAHDDLAVHAQELQLLHNNANSDAMPVTAAQPSSVVVERVATYSSVTARESLENLRRRQQQQLEQRRRTGLLMSDDIDTTYDTIDYDSINLFAVGSRTSSHAAAAADNSAVYNNGSDLYAEIGTGPSSAQSSTTYAKVSDLTEDQSMSAAAVAPPMDDLVQLTSHDAAAEAADSYSNIDHITSSSSPAGQVTHPTAVYAVVSRNRTATSQTNPVTASSPTDNASTADARRDLYTRVIKRQDGRRPSPSRGHQSVVLQPTASGGLSADGYASIDDPLRDQQPAQNYSVDFYDVIRDDLSLTASSDFDPNYESVPQTVTAVTSAASGTVDSVAGSSGTDGGQRPRDPAVTTSVASTASGGRQTDPTGPRGLLIREHIYDEVSLPPTKCALNVTHTDV